MARPDGSHACWGCATGSAVLRDEFGHTLCAGCVDRYEVDPHTTSSISAEKPVWLGGEPAPALAGTA